MPEKLRKGEVKAYLILLSCKTADDLSPDHVTTHFESRLARFNIPRFVAYVDEFPCTPSNKIAKNKLIEGVDDLRSGTYDRLHEVWRYPISRIGAPCLTMRSRILSNTFA